MRSLATIIEEAHELFPFKGVNHLAWAKRIMYRLEQGDKTLSMIQISFAKEALNIDQPDK